MDNKWSDIVLHNIWLVHSPDSADEAQTDTHHKRVARVQALQFIYIYM